jgi:hypothetical protein
MPPCIGTVDHYITRCGTQNLRVIICGVPVPVLSTDLDSGHLAPRAVFGSMKPFHLPPFLLVGHKIENFPQLQESTFST